MKKLGIVGGLGPASTVDYYNGIISLFREKLGADAYPELLINSVNMTSVVSKMAVGDYRSVGEIIGRAIAQLKAAGADFAAVSANTPHIAWNYFAPQAEIPLVSLIEETCKYIKSRDYKNVLIFGTGFTMKNGLYTDLFDAHSICWTLPEPQDIETVADIVYPNLENGIVLDSEREKMVAIAEKYISRCGCDSLLLGCTEIPLLIKGSDVSVPLINTTKIHIDVLTDMIING